EYARRGWRLPSGIERVYVNARARRELGWRPRYDFRSVVASLRAGQDPRSPLARAVGAKGYHRGPSDGPITPSIIGFHQDADGHWSPSSPAGTTSTSGTIRHG